MGDFRLAGKLNPRGAAVFAQLGGWDLGTFRLNGASGLGNLLFPWARCVVAAERYGLPVIWPTWPQVAPGPILRREPSRFYANLFRPDPRTYICGFAKARMLFTKARAPEMALRDAHGAGPDDKVYEFAGMHGYFSTILRDHELVRKRLLEMTRCNHVPFGVAKPHIAVHVRLGDFSVPRSADELQTPSENINLRLPLEWYVYAVEQLREITGPSLPVRIFSDGSDEELSSLMRIPNCSRSRRGSVIGELLELAQGSVLVASGSTFSMWASYLGRMPTVWFPGRIRQRLYTERPGEEVELASGCRLSPEFHRSVSLLAGA